MSGEWGALLNGVYLSGGDGTQWQAILNTPGCEEHGTVIEAGCLTSTPDGLGLPDRRTSDYAIIGRDGVGRGGQDFYEPRIITLTASICPDDACAACPSSREKVAALRRAWDRSCDEDELVIFSDCHSLDEAILNLVPNPSFEDELPTDWSAVTGTLALTTAQAFSGIQSAQVTATDSGPAIITTTGLGGFPVTGGQTYTASGYSRAATTGRLFGVSITWYNAAGAQIAQNFATGNDTTTGWTRASVTATAPALAVTGAVVYQWFDTAVGEVHYADGVMVTQTASLLDYFDGSLPDDTYSYSWIGVANDSASRREANRALVGPYGIVGRPRQFSVVWLNGKSKCAEVTMRFDAQDHRMFILDECGIPGSGSQCAIVEPGSTENTQMCFTDDEVCFPLCFDQPVGNLPGQPVPITVSGDDCACPIITLHGRLTSPVLEVLESGQEIQYKGTISASDQPVIIDGEQGTALQGGATRTHLLFGDTRMCFSPGNQTLVLRSFGVDDDGYAEVCWRPVVSGA